MGEPNAFAKLALLLWPLVTLVWMKRTGRPIASAITLFLWGFLLLPELTYWKIPGLPELGKQAIVPASVLAALLAFHRRRLVGRFTFDGFSSVVLGAIVGGGLITGAANGDALRWGRTLLPGISAYDGFQMLVGDVLIYFVPFFLLRGLVRTHQELLVAFRALVHAALWMSAIALFEMRMSPQLHTWIYGFIPIDSWVQVVRAGGYRPLGFTRHGLAFVLYFFAATMAASALRREPGAGEGRRIGAWVAPYLFAVTLAFGSLGATLYTLIGLALTRLAPIRVQLAVAAAAGLFAISFPYQRWHDTFPTERWVESARANADEARAQSLEFRFMNEDLLLERIKERWVVGWGEFDRANVFDSYDGRRVTVRDGAWVIQFGDRGVIGLGWMFGMLVVPLLGAYFAVRRAPRAQRPALAALAVMLAIGVVDLLPNGAFHPLAFSFAGALAGRRLALGAAPARAARHLGVPAAPTR